MILTFSIALLWMGIVLFVIYLLWNPKKAREMKKWIIGTLVIVALFFVAAFIDGVFIRH